MDIFDIAPNIMVRDAVDGGREFRCRYFGTKLVSTFGYDPTGNLLADVYDPSSAKTAVDRYHSALVCDTPTRVVGYVDLVETTLPTTFESILLPLDDNHGERNHIICAFDFSYELVDEDFDFGCNPAKWSGIRFPGAA